ncbi:restriction endonuclease subunit S [Meiothermus taiwanensis]|uniref:restriction endonuclease subunit S n=1 Tax=Meiothermus taiwanensis TaxID=172827 RepID=UPI001651D25D|nr:restriction endonuclease subunit S [Meiothermus taiwanensis]
MKLAEVAQINPPRPRNLGLSGDEPTFFVSMSAVDDLTGMIKSPELKPFGEVCRGYTYFEEGDVLFAKITPCMQNGKHTIASGLTNGFGFGSTEFHIIRPGPSITAEWIHFYVRRPEVLSDAANHFKGAVGHQRVPSEYLENLELPLPPLETQRRIAAILTEQMGAVEKARKAAEDGLEAARKLTAAHLRAVFESEEARGWPGRLAREIGVVSGGIQKTPQRKPSAFHKPFLTVRNVQNGWIDLSNVERFEVTPEELERYRLVRGDLLIVEGNGSRGHIGRCAIFHGEIEDCVHQNHLIRLRCHETASPTYLFWYLASPDGRKQLLEKAKTTTGLYTLSVSKIEALEVPLPPLETQHRIVAELNAKLEATQALIRSLEAQLEAIRALPAAILRRAFSGEL